MDLPRRDSNPDGFEVIEHKDAHLSPDDLAKLQSWLEPTDYLADSSECHRHLLSRAPGTGLWLAETPRYQQWLSSPDHASLWVKGVPGAGKSVLAASAVQHLKDTHGNSEDEGVPVLFFFFRHIIRANRYARCLMRDWLAQLLPYSVSLQGAMVELSKRREVEEIRDDELWEKLLGGLASLPKAFCVVDALDEMDTDDVAGFFPRLNKLAMFRPEAVKIFMTSRPRQDIQMHLTAASIVHISLEEDRVGKEIQAFIAHRLTQAVPSDADKHASLAAAIASRSKGLFLYARLLIDQILPALQLGQDVEIDSTPVHLENMYNEILAKRVKDLGIDREVQESMLACVTHSTRPLRLRELAGLLVWRGQVSPESEAKTIARQACHPLLEILEDETVQVIHHSFSEFLFDTNRLTRDTGSSQFPVFDSKKVHRDLAMACMEVNIRVLEERNFQGAAKYPLFNYSKYNWRHHVMYDKDINDDALFDTLEMLGQLHNKQDSDGKYLNYGDALVGDIWLRDGETPLGLAAETGLAHLARRRLSEYQASLSVREIDPSDSQPEYTRSSLEFIIKTAAENQHIEVVKVIWPNQSIPFEWSKWGQSSLLWDAIRQDHPRVLKALIDLGMSLTILDSDSKEARKMSLEMAGSPEIVEELLPFMDAEELSHCLCEWARDGRPDLIKVCLRPQLEDGCASPALKKVCEWDRKSASHIECVRVLLPWCPEVKQKSYIPHEQAHLHALVRTWTNENHDISAEIFDLLVEAGADLEARNDDGNTPIFGLFPDISVDHGSQRRLRHIIKAGADALVSGEGGASLLYRALQSRLDLDVLQLLIDQGADVHALKPSGAEDGDEDEGNKRMIPVLGAYWRTAHPLDWVEPQLDPPWNTVREVTEFLISKGANIGDGGDPAGVISRALESCDIASLKMLLATDTANTRFDSCLFSINVHFNNENKSHGRQKYLRMVPRDPLPFIQTLVEAGACLETRSDDDGRTPLLDSLRLHPRLFEAFVAAGADVNARDNAGRGILHRVLTPSEDDDMWSGETTSPPDHVRIRELVEKYGADPCQCDGEGNNLLHLAVSRGPNDYDSNIEYRSIDPLLQLLLGYGISPRAKNNAGQTPLHVILDYSKPWRRTRGKELNYVENVISILEKTAEGCGINDTDSEDLTPLHYAAISARGLSPELLHILISHGADPRAKAKRGRNALHLACRARNPAAVQYLLDQGHGPIHETDDDGRTPLFDACVSGFVESVSFLLRAGAKWDVTDNNGWTPFHACAELNAEQALWNSNEGRRLRDEEIVFDRYRPCMLGKPDRKGRFSENGPPAHRHGFTLVNPCVLPNEGMAAAAVVRSLIKGGADPNVQGGNPRQTPLLRAQALGCHSVAAALQAWSDQAQEIDLGKYRGYDSETLEISEDVLRDPWYTISSLSLTDMSLLKQQGANLVSPATSVHVLMQDLDEEVSCYYRMSFMEWVAVTGLTEAMAALGDVAQQGMMDPASTPIDAWTKKAIAKAEGHRIPYRQFRHSNRQLVERKTRWWPEKLETLQDLYNLVPWAFEPLLQVACRRKSPNVEMIKTLLDRCDLPVTLPSHAHKYLGVHRPSTEPMACNTILHVMAREQHYWHLEAINELTRNPAKVGSLDFNGLDFDGDTPLHVAVNNPGPFTDRFIRLLVEKGADPHALNSDERTALELCPGKLIAAFASCGVDVAARMKFELFVAVAQLDKDAVNAALDAGADINYSERDVLKRLEGVHYKIDSNYKDSKKTTPIYAAIYFDDDSPDGPRKDEQREEVVRCLIERGADVYVDMPEMRDFNDSLKRPLQNMPLLHHLFEAVMRRRSLLEVFFDYTVFERKGPVDFNRRDQTGRTVFLAACNAGTPVHWQNIDPEEDDMYDAEECLREIEEEGGEPHSLSGDKWMADWDSTGLFLRMLDYGADVTAVGADGKNALHTLLSNPCVQEHHIMAFLSLPASHPLIHARDNDGFTPLQHALRVFRPAVVERLLALGASGLTETDPDGLTALHRIARQCVSVTVSEPLVDEGPGRSKHWTTARPTLQRRGFVSKAKALWNKCIDLGLDVNQPDPNGNPPLFHYVGQHEGDTSPPLHRSLHDCDRPDAVLGWVNARWLSSGLRYVRHFDDFFAGADLSARNKAGETVLHVLASKKLLGAGDNDDGTTSRGDHDVRLIEFFVGEKGVDRFVEDANGQTCLDVAASEEREDILELFKQRN